MEKGMGRGNFITKMEVSMKEIGYKIKWQVMESYIINQEI